MRASATTIITRDIDADDHHRDFVAPMRDYIHRYHWCPGDFWHAEWGFNSDWTTCHDDHHRDGDNNDYWG
jgi:hypothetical protein